MKLVSVEQKYKDGLINLALDTLDKKKQALVFVNSKKSAEKEAEEISKKINLDTEELNKLSNQVLSVLSKATDQCNRLSDCVKKGIAFHHAGLASEQKRLVEDAFRQGKIKIICATPTLAAGLDIPAWRVIIRDVKRYVSKYGMKYIPVLEFLQMAGRAGRPKYDKDGEAIVIVQTENEKQTIKEKFIYGDPEAIYSKLAVEPVLRTFLLSLISAKIVRSRKEIVEFFSKTFWAYQYKDLDLLEQIIEKMLTLLIKWDLIQLVDDYYRATILGKRISELYLDPLTAHELVIGLKRAKEIKLNDFSILHLITNTLEMRPYLSVKTKEFDQIQEKSALMDGYLLKHEPSMFDSEYDEWLSGFKTTLMFNDWIDEKDEQYLLEEYNIRPGELRVKLETADWLLYSLTEIARIEQLQDLIKEINKTRFRLKYGVKEELLTLLRLEGIGRVRARKLYRAGVKDLGAIKKSKIEDLEKLLGKQLALSIKKQVGIEDEKNNNK